MDVLAVDDEPGALKLLVKAISAAIPEARIHAFRTGSDALE